MTLKAPIPHLTDKTIYLVYHTTQSPALDGMLAGMIATEMGATMISLDTAGGGLGAYEARQHVLSAGSLDANGLFWNEWASGHFTPPALPPGVIAQHPDPLLLISVNSAVTAQTEMAERLLNLPEQTTCEVLKIHVTETEKGWHISGNLPPHVPLFWWRDTYGRPWPADFKRPEFDEIVALLIVGSEHRLRQTYPAVLAALGDAADSAGLALNLRFWDPTGAPETALPEALKDCDGVLLPGGADMAQVSGQIRVARHALAHNIPMLGLCLGMQTITTAVAQMRAGFNDANMEEASPNAETKVFRRLHHIEVPGGYRIGLKQMRIVPETRLAQIMGGAQDPVPIHANHSYCLDPILLPSLEAAGLQVAAWQEDATIVDAIGVPDRRFCIGLQGHPELITRRGTPSPLFAAFLDAARL